MFPAQEAARIAAKELFLDEPHLSVSEAARRLRAEGHGLDTNVITGIRQDIRMLINSAGDKSDLRRQPPSEIMDKIRPFVRRRAEIETFRNNVAAPKNEPFNPIRFSNQQPLKPVQEPVVVPTTPPPAPTPPLAFLPQAAPVVSEPTTTEEEQRAWLDGWVLENPYKTAPKAMEVLQAQFGTSLLNLNYIASVLKIARELKDEDSAPPRPPVLPAAVPAPAPVATKTVTPPQSKQESKPLAAYIVELAMAMRQMGLSKIEVIDDHIRFERVL